MSLRPLGDTHSLQWVNADSNHPTRSYTQLAMSQRRWQSFNAEINSACNESTQMTYIQRRDKLSLQWVNADNTHSMQIYTQLTMSQCEWLPFNVEIHSACNESTRMTHIQRRDTLSLQWVNAYDTHSSQRFTQLAMSQSKEKHKMPIQCGDTLSLQWVNTDYTYSTPRYTRLQWVKGTYQWDIREGREAVWLTFCLSL